MRTYSIYLILFLAGILASCEDFLDQSPKYNLTLENAVTDYNGAKNIINGMYSVIAKSSNFGGEEGKVYMDLSLKDNEVTIKIKDDGVGIDNIHRAMEPLFTTKPELERSGMGFSFMEAFMDELEVHSRKQKGTTVIMKKKIGDSNI